MERGGCSCTAARPAHGGRATCRARATRAVAVVVLMMGTSYGGSSSSSPFLVFFFFFLLLWWVMGHP